MARLIQKSGYIKNGKATGYMEYVATRDGVEKHRACDQEAGAVYRKTAEGLP